MNGQWWLAETLRLFTRTLTARARVACLLLALLALCGIPAQAQFTLVEERRYHIDMDCVAYFENRCVLFQGSFYANRGEKFMIEFDPNEVSWWNRYDVDVYVHGPGKRFDSRIGSFGSSNFFDFLIDESREFEFSIVRQGSSARPKGTAVVSAYVLSRNPSDRRAAPKSPTPDPIQILDSGNVVWGSLDDRHPIDRYAFHARAGDFVTISMDAEDSGLDPFLELRGPNDEPIASDDDGGGGYNALIADFAIQRAGRHTIIARSYESASDGEYRLSLHIDGASYAAYRGIVVDRNCSLADAIRAANEDRAFGACPAGSGADTISLADDIDLWGELPHIQSEIRIEGNNKRINGGGRQRLFVVDSGAALTIRQATLTGGRAADDGELNLVGDGGAILNHGTLRLEDCLLRDNQAGEDGGALRNLGSLSTIRTRFVDNLAGRQGGAIYSADGSASGPDYARLEIDESEFRGNHARRHAGALFIGGAARIDDSFFGGNQADVSGGAIYSLGRAEISRSRFIDNLSQKNAGAIFIDYKSQISVRESYFAANSTSGNGGGVMVYGWGRAIIQASEFDNNSASRGGGVMARGFSRGGRDFYGELHLSDSQLRGNRGGDCVLDVYGDLAVDARNYIGDGGCRRG